MPLPAVFDFSLDVEIFEVTESVILMKGININPKSIIILSLLICLATASASKANDLYLSIILTESEHSKDSNSTKTVITLNGAKIVYEETHSGSRAGGKEPIYKEHTLTAQEIVELKRLINAKNLLRSRSSKYPPGNVLYRYYDLTVKVRWQGRRSLIKISGPITSDKMTNSRLYQDTDALLGYVKAMINKG